VHTSTRSLKHNTNDNTSWRKNQEHCLRIANSHAVTIITEMTMVPRLFTVGWIHLSNTASQWRLQTNNGPTIRKALNLLSPGYYSVDQSTHGQSLQMQVAFPVIWSQRFLCSPATFQSKLDAVRVELLCWAHFLKTFPRILPGHEMIVPCLVKTG